MRVLTVASIVAVVLIARAAAQEQEAPTLPKQQKQHEWLKQLVGEWEVEAEMFMGPDQPPMKSKGAETVRAIGGFWVQGEIKSQVFGESFTGILTLGYDAEKKQYVGTWIDSMTGHLWTYRGAVNDKGDMLTLETEGPCHTGETCRFKETIEIKSKDHKVFTSKMEMDGEWITIMTANYKRKK